MTHLPTIINDLAMILLVAGVTTILFKKINQPLVLGYIVAGFITGPHFNFFPTITDKANVHAWSEIGVIFLLFALGLAVLLTLECLQERGVQIRAALEKKSGFVQWLTVTALLLAVLLLGVFRAGYIPSGFIYTQF